MTAIDARPEQPTTSPSAATVAAPRRPLRSRFAAGHVVAAVAAVVAVVANVAVLRAADHTVPLLVLAADAPAGTAVADLTLRAADARLDQSTLATLLTPDRVDALADHVTTTALVAGAPVPRSLLRERAGADGVRRMSVPVPKEQAVGGAITPGDLVDVLRVDDGVARVIVAGAEVLAVDAGGEATLGGLSRFSITVAVDLETARCLAAALDAASLTVLLSTGQEPATVDPCGPAAEEAAP